MEFNNQIKSFSKRIEALIQNIKTEEATKTSLIMPFFQLLGYDVFNPEEFIPEFTSDVGIKKGEKVDYAIKIEGNVVLLIEAKPVFEKLEKHDSQLFRYFSVSKAKFAILTNGVNYKFYTDLDEHNKMDPKPFLDINLLDIKDSQINELIKFQKSTFDVDYIFNTAEELKYTNEIKQLLSQQLENPTESFTSYIIGEIYSGRKTQNVLDKFTPIVKKSYVQFINELVNEKIKNALDNDSKVKEEVAISSETVSVEPKIITTDEELESFYIIKNILKDTIDYARISYKDTESYFNVLIDNNVRKWVCRIFFNSKNKYLIVNSEQNNGEKFEFEEIVDLYKYKDILIDAAKRFS